MPTDPPTAVAPATPDDPLRREVIAAAGERFRRYGFKSVTMDDIARQLGRSKKTLYTVVANKQALIDLVVDDDMRCDDEHVAQARTEASDAVDEMLRIARYFSDSMRQMSPAAMYDLQKYYRPTWERIDRHHRLEMVEHVRANLRRGQAEGLYRDDMDRELIAHLFVNSPKAFLDESAYQPKQDTWGHVLTQWMRYHLLGVVSDAGRDLLGRYLSALAPASQSPADA